MLKHRKCRQWKIQSSHLNTWTIIAVIYASKVAAKEKLDLKEVQLLAASYQEKVQPSVDELDYNSDEFQSDGSSGVKIGIDQNVMSNFVVSLFPHS